MSTVLVNDRIVTIRLAWENWRRQSDFAELDDYIFTSETMRGAQSVWTDNLMKQHIRPVVPAAFTKRSAGTFRHTYGTLLKQRGRREDGPGALTARQQQDHA